MKNNAWVTVNNDFWSRVRWFANDLISDQSIVIHGSEYIILFLTRYFILNTKFR